MSALRHYWILLFFLLSYVQAAGQKKEESPRPDSTQVVNISNLLEQVGKDAAETKKLLELAQDTSHVESYRKSISELDTSLVKVREQSDYFLQSFARQWLIQNLYAKWTRLHDDWEDLSTMIFNSTANVEARLQSTRELKSTWAKNQAAVAQDSVSVALHKPIADLVGSLTQTEKLFEDKIKIYLFFQERIAINRAEINRYLEILDPLRKQDFVSSFKRDDKFLWERTDEYRRPRFDLQMIRSVQFASRDIVEYIRSSVGKLVLVIGLAVFLLYLFLKHSKEVRDVEGDNPELTEDKLRSIKYPLTYSYTFTLLIGLMVLTNRPPLLTEFLLLLFTVPLVMLVVKRSKGIVKTITASFLILYWFDFLTDFLVLNPLIGGYIDVFNAVVTSILLYLTYRNRMVIKSQFTRLNDFFLQLVPFLLFLNVLSIILLLSGFTNLGRMLTTGTITFVYLAPVIIICSVTLQDLFHVLENTPFVRSSNAAKNYYYLLYRLVKLGAFYLLCVAFLASFMLTPLFKEVWMQVWNFGGQFGEFNITVGDIMEFFIIIFVSWVISAVLRVLLTDEILSRTSLQRGVPMAIGVIVRYAVIFLGFILAVASTGFDLAKISILAGGLGVGIGFGLQHLVANFIAGLILIFERPMVVGDTVESELIEGEVKQIGIRSSKILTYDGAEVIIPNSNLINNKLSNYTLSNYSRRQLILVRTSVKADPEKVLEILNRIVRQHENVIATPEPFVLFDGQLEQSFQFKIYYWLISGMFKTRGELNLKIFRELKELGVELPIPVQEIRRSLEEESDVSNS